MLGLRTPLALMRLVAKAALNAVGFGVAGDFAVEVLPGMAHDVWKWWAKDKPPQEVAEEVQAAAQLSSEEAHQLAIQAVAAEAAGKSVEVQKVVTQYVELIPLSITQSLRRPEDPSGKSVPAAFAVKTPADVMCLLPARLPRFQTDDAPASLHGWVLVKRLGAGGFGEVWLARHPKAKNVFAAVKFCLDPKARDALVHEKHVIDQVMSLGALPTIVPLQDFDLESDPPYLKYQFIPGGDLLEFASHFQGVKATAAIRHLAETVGRFHRLQPPVVHRDLKPANILVEKEPLPGGGSRLRLRVADFGIGGTALMLEQDRARTMPSAALPPVLLGSHTALYASKQQKKGADPDPRDDVFSLGVLWYQLLIGDLTSERPAGGWWKRTVAELGLSTPLIDLLEGCCEDVPAARPKDAAEMADRIQAAAQGTITPQSPPPPPPPPPPGPNLAQIAEQKKRERTERHTEARNFEQRGLYAEAATALEKLPADRRDATYYDSLVQRRDEVIALEKELHTAAHNDQLTFRHRPMALRWKELQPFRARDLDALLAQIPELGARFTNSVQMPFVLVPAGTFWMGGGGGTAGDKQVTITEPFYIGVYPVTQAQWQAVMGNNPSHFDRSKGGGPDHPVEQVSWEDAKGFLQRLNVHEKDRGLLYRLPTEAEWEYSCRGGLSSQADCSYHFYLDRPSNSLSSTQANFNGDHPEGGAAKGPNLQRTTKVGSYKPNRLGICDMHGNVWEWCEDSYDEGSERVVRGGGWSNRGSYCQAADRGRLAPSDRDGILGLRVVAVPSGTK